MQGHLVFLRVRHGAAKGHSILDRQPD